MSEWTGSTDDLKADRIVNDIFDGPKQGVPASLIAPGLAAGYYFNFLDIVARQLEFGVINLEDGGKSDPQIKNGGSEFDFENTSIQIIIPKWLTAEAFQRCEEDFGQSQRGSIFLNRQKRYYGINYRVVEVGSTRRLQIVDLARPAMALKRCYEEMIRSVNTDEDSRDGSWREIQRVELGAFEKTLRKMQARGYGTFTNKLDIAYRG